MFNKELEKHEKIIIETKPESFRMNKVIKNEFIMLIILIIMFIASFFVKVMPVIIVLGIMVGFIAYPLTRNCINRNKRITAEQYCITNKRIITYSQLTSIYESGYYKELKNYYLEPNFGKTVDIVLLDDTGQNYIEMLSVKEELIKEIKKVHKDLKVSEEKHE